MIHPIQTEILKLLKSSHSARFNDLKPDYMTSDHFNFHIKRLVELSYIQKQTDGTYGLTPEGKEAANRIDDTKQTVHSAQVQPKVSLLFIIRRTDTDGTKYVAKRRAQHPFMGHLAFPTWGIEKGVKIEETARTYLPHTTGLQGEPQIIGQIRRIDKDSNTGRVVSDFLLLVTLVDEPSGTLTHDHHKAEQRWYTKEEILSAKKLTGVPPYAFKMLEDLSSPRLVEIEFEIKEGGF